MKLAPRFALAATFGLALVGVAYASGAGFTITAAGRDMGQPEDAGDVPVYRLKVAVGETVTLVSQGVVVPRGRAGSPSEADAAAWLFDDTAMQLVPYDKKAADKTKTVVALKPLKAGPTRVRFVGNILGYDRKYDVLIDVTDAKK